MWEVFVSLAGRMIQHMAGFDFMKNEPNYNSGSFK